MTNDLSVNAKGSRAAGTCSWGCMWFPGYTALQKHTEDGFETWQHLHILKVQAHLDAKKKKRIEIFLESLKDSANLKCHNRGSSYLENNF